MVEAVLAYDPDLPILGLPRLGAAADRPASASVRPVTEYFVDRNYTADGRLVDRREPDALITDPEYAARRAVRAAAGGHGRVVLHPWRHPRRGRHGPGRTRRAGARRSRRSAPFVESAMTRRLLAYGAGAVLLECADLAETRAPAPGRSSSGSTRSSEIVPGARTLLLRLQPAARRRRAPGPARPARRRPRRRRTSRRRVDHPGRLLRRRSGRGRRAHRTEPRRGGRRPHRPGLDRRLLRLRPRLRLPGRRARPAPGAAAGPPRTTVPAGAVGLADAFSGVYPRSGPGRLAADRPHRRRPVGPRPRPAGPAPAGRPGPVHAPHDHRRGDRPAGHRAGPRPSRAGPPRGLALRGGRPHRAPAGQPAGRQPGGRRHHRGHPRRADRPGHGHALGGGDRRADHGAGQRPADGRRTACSRCRPATG